MHKNLWLLVPLTLGQACRTTEDGDSACPGCFDAAWMLWNLKTGVKDGAFAAVTSSSKGLLEPDLEVVLYENADENGEYASCTAHYLASSEAAQGIDGAWFDWVLDLSLASSDCPEISDGDLLNELTGWSWEIGFHELDSALEAGLADWFGADWKSEGAPYYFGGYTVLEGDPVGSGGQTHYGRAYELDENMNIADEANGGKLLRTSEVSAGSDGYYELYADTLGDGAGSGR